VEKIVGVKGFASVDGIVLSVDTHLDLHVAVALDQLGRRLGEASVPTTVEGYEKLLCWAEGFGPVRCAGVEGTSSYGAGLTRHLRSRGIEVLEVERPKHRGRGSHRNLQKSDPSDAERAARAVLAGEASGVPKSGDGSVEMIRALRAARRSTVKARTQRGRQPATKLAREGTGGAAPPLARAPDEGARLGGHALAPRRRPPRRGLGHQARAPLGGPPLRGPLRGDRRSGRTPRWAGGASGPGVGLLGGHRHGKRRDAPDRGLKDNPERLGSEASFANLCGVSPVEASSGKVVRHRLTRSGRRGRSLLSM
jgi:transposase